MIGASRRPLADYEGTTWLGHPQAPHLRIEVGDDDLVFHAPSGVTRIPWSRIKMMDVDIPTASWTLARTSRSFLAAMDNLNIANSNGVAFASETRFGNRDIRIDLVLDDGSGFTGWAQKHQPLGYPEPETQAAIAVLQGRVPR